MSVIASRSAAREWLRSHRPLLLVLAIAGAVYISALPAHRVGTWTDDGFYISLAHSLAAGKGMRLIHLPGQPASAVVPPGFPLLLSPVAWLLPDRVPAFQWVSLLFALATLPLFYRLAASRLPSTLALAALVLFALNPTIVSASTWVMSEAPFVFFLLLSVMVVERLVAARPVASWPLLVGAGLATAALLLMRYFGLPVVGTIVLYVLIRLRNWRAIAFATVVGLGVLVPTVTFGAEAAMARYGSVGTSLLGFLSAHGSSIEGPANAAAAVTATTRLSFGAALLRNTGHLLTSALPDTIILLFGGPQVTALFGSLGLAVVPIIVQSLISAVIMVGYGLCFRQRITAVEVIVPTYVLFLLVVTQGKWQDSGSAFRYIFPIIPFALVYVLCTINWLDRLIRRQAWWPEALRHCAVLTGLVAASLLLVYLARDVQAVGNPVRNRIPDISLGATWINEHVAADAVVMAEVPRSSFVYARRVIVPYPDGFYEADIVYPGSSFCASVECLEAAIDQFGVDYVLISPQLVSGRPFHWSSYTERYVLPALQARPERFRMVYNGEDGLVQVYEVRSGQ